jgi:hypothetical protein
VDGTMVDAATIRTGQHIDRVRRRDFDTGKQEAKTN